MDFQPIDFHQVPFGSIEQAECAPQIEDENFDGIAIRIPEEIKADASEELQVPICGYYQLPTGPLLMGAEMIIHMRNTDAEALPPVSGQVVTDEGENEPDVPPPWEDDPIDPRDFEGQISQSFFYLDAQRYIHQPLPPGTYELCVSYGERQSNVAKVVITRK
jgi:hypothetical protein